MEREQDRQRTRTRRGFLHGAAGVGAGVAAASVVNIAAFGTSARQAEAAAMPAEDVRTILDLAATAEALAVTFYYTVIYGATFRIDEPAAGTLRSAMDAERNHLEILRLLGGTPSQRQFSFPERLLTDASTFVGTGLELEAALTGIYLAATHQFAVLRQPSLAATAAQLGASEAQHLMLLHHLAGVAPQDQTVPVAAFPRVSEASVALAPFLTRGIGSRNVARFP